MVWPVLRYDSKSLGEPNAITIEEYWQSLFDFIFSGTYVAVAVVVSYFTSHFCSDGEQRWSSGITAFMIGSKN